MSLYNHTLVTEFINYEERLPKEKIDEGLALPRETFIEDLETFITDLQTETGYYYGEGDINFYLLHYAINFLSVLQAKESLPKLVEVINEDEEFTDFWFSEFLDPSYISFLFYHFFKDDFDTLWEIIIKKQNNNLIHSGLINIPAQVALKEPNKRQKAIDFYKYLMEFIFRLEEKKSLFDEFEIDTIIQSVLLIEGKELREQVLQLHDDGLTDDLLWTKKQTIEEFEKPYYSTLSDKKLNLDLTIYKFFEKSMGSSFTHELNKEEQERRDEEFKEAAKKYGMSIQNFRNRLKEESNEENLSFNHYDPKTDKPLYGRNDKVSVKYEDGKTLENVKYKKVEKDVKEGKCEIIK